MRIEPPKFDWEYSVNAKQLGATLAFVIIGILVVKAIGKKVGGGLGSLTAGI